MYLVNLILPGEVVLFPGLGQKHLPLPHEWNELLSPCVLLKVSDPPTGVRRYGFCLATYDSADAASWEGPVNWEQVDVVLNAVQQLCDHHCEAKPRAIAISAGGHKLMALLARLMTSSYTFRFSLVAFINAALHPETFHIGRRTILSQDIRVIVQHHFYDSLSPWLPVAQFWQDTATAARGAIHINCLHEKLAQYFGRTYHAVHGHLLRQKDFWICCQSAPDLNPRTFAQWASEHHLGNAHLCNDSGLTFLRWDSSAFPWAWEWYCYGRKGSLLTGEPMVDASKRQRTTAWTLRLRALLSAGPHLLS